MITAADWKARADMPKTRAHVLRPGWSRSLCGLQALNIRWESGEGRVQCRMCLLRIEKSHHWMHLLGILR